MCLSEFRQSTENDCAVNKAKLVWHSLPNMLIHIDYITLCLPAATRLLLINSFLFAPSTSSSSTCGLSPPVPEEELFWSLPIISSVAQYTSQGVIVHKTWYFNSLMVCLNCWLTDSMKYNICSVFHLVWILKNVSFTCCNSSFVPSYLQHFEATICIAPHEVRPQLPSLIWSKSLLKSILIYYKYWLVIVISWATRHLWLNGKSHF